MLLIYKNIVYRKKGAIRIQFFLNKGGEKKTQFPERIVAFWKVPEVGLEPTRSNEHMALNHACLPIPASGR